MARRLEGLPIGNFVQYQPPEPELEEEAQDNQVDGVLVLPPLQDHEPMYPSEYVAYCQRRIKEYSRQHGKPPEWKLEAER